MTGFVMFNFIKQLGRLTEPMENGVQRIYYYYRPTISMHFSTQNSFGLAGNSIFFSCAGRISQIAGICYQSQVQISKLIKTELKWLHKITLALAVRGFPPIAIAYTSIS